MSDLEETNDNINNKKMDVRVKLSTLWIIVMFNMIYADILALITPGAIAGIMTGYSGSVELTQELLFVAALLLEIPILMIFLSRALKYNINRWANIIAAVVTILFVLAGIETDPFFLFFVSIEVILMLLIIRTAWKWPNPKM